MEDHAGPNTRSSTGTTNYKLDDMPFSDVKLINSTLKPHDYVCVANVVVLDAQNLQPMVAALQRLRKAKCAHVADLVLHHT